MRLWRLCPRPQAKPVPCTHCGLPAPGVENTLGPVFCCRACRQVYELALALTAPAPA